MSDMIQTLLTSIKWLKSTPLPLEDLTSGESLGFMDRIWRTTLKMPQSPQRSMVRVARSSSRTKSPARDTAGARSGSALARAASFRAKIRPEAEARAEEFAESIVKSVKMCMSSLYSEAELPGLSAGEVSLQHGRVSGMWKVSRGGSAEMCTSVDKIKLTFSLLIRGIACSYDFSGRRLHGEVSCSYEKLQFRVQICQKVTPECFTDKLTLEHLSLEDVKGVRMNVSGFGPLNWVAGKSVTNVIQETVLQVVEDHLKAGVLMALHNSSFFFHIRPTVSQNLEPAGILVC